MYHQGRFISTARSKSANIEFLNNARAFEEYLEQLEGAISEGNQLYHATWKGLSILIEILEELQSDQ